MQNLNNRDCIVIVSRLYRNRIVVVLCYDHDLLNCDEIYYYVLLLCLNDWKDSNMVISQFICDDFTVYLLNVT